MRTDFRLLAVFLLLSVFLLTSCKKDVQGDALTIAVTEQEFDMHGGTRKIEFSSSCAWKATSSQAWCTLSSISGSYQATYIIVTVSANETFDNRTAVISFTAGSISKEVSVIQTGADGIIVLTESVNLPYSSKEFTIETKSASTVSASVDAKSSSWLYVVGSTGTDNNRTFSFSAATNLADEDRTATITFSASGKTATAIVHQMARPSGSDRVTPEGKPGWTMKVVDDGIIYWEFKGRDPVSNANQFVHVADIDLNKGYRLGYNYDANKNICSDILKMYDATVSMNGGFGATQIFIKVDGKVHRNIEKDKNADTGVLNWRNDAGICADTDGRVFIANAIFSQDGDGQSEYGGQLSAQRNFFTNTLSGVPNIISGSPLLIDRYVPLGLTYIPEGEGWEKHRDDTEHPFYHQDYRHPRTAIGITGDNRLIMFVVNGRLSNCAGMNAREMTQFLIDNFNPEYAMNLDGGGSSTMCVKGLGDSRTNVVNWPCDNGRCDHSGERTVQTFLFITK